MSSADGVDIPDSLRNKIPVSLDKLVAEGPEHVNHGNDFDRWRLTDPEGIVVGQVRVYRGRRDERGQKESVFIPARTVPLSEAFTLPYAEAFSTYLRQHLEAYLHSQGDTTPVDAALRKGPTIVGAIGEAYFLRWNVYFRDEKRGEYTIHDMDPEKLRVANQHPEEGMRRYDGRIPGYLNSSIVTSNEEVCFRKGIPTGRDQPLYIQGIQEGNLRPPDSVVLRWGRTLAPETPDNRFSFTQARIDHLKDIPFP